VEVIFMSASDSQFMLRALELAELGRGSVEPNPLVGCVIAQGEQIVGEGWHAKFGGPHAEVAALAAASERARGATMYVTLEPCCHHGKTPPCVEAIVPAGIRRVVAAMRDPFPKVAGIGVHRLRAAGVEVEVGLHEIEARALNAPYLKLLGTGRPWIIAKWAMTLDGKMATRSGQSQWISGPTSRAVVHDLRSRVDAILIGRATAQADDALLTARLPDGAPPRRVATRIVADALCHLATDSQLVKTAREVPLLVVCGPLADATEIHRLTDAGCEVLCLTAITHAERLVQLLAELGRRRFTNVLVEGGSHMLGGLFDAGQIDEVHAFIAPKLFGGLCAVSPIAGEGIGPIAAALTLDNPRWQQLGSDLYVRGLIKR